MATDILVKEGISSITEALVATYTECSRINHLGHQPLPSKEGVVDILDDLREVIFPGFGRRQGLHIANVEYYVGNLVDALHDKLTQQIARALRHDMCQESPHIDYEALAQKLATTPELAALRAKLQANRLTAPLFDTDQFCRHLESAYLTMVERHLAGEAPKGFDVEK